MWDRPGRYYPCLAAEETKAQKNEAVNCASLTLFLAFCHTSLAKLTWRLKFTLVISDEFKLMGTQQFLLAVLYNSKEVSQWIVTQVWPELLIRLPSLQTAPTDLRVDGTGLHLQVELWTTYKRDLQCLTLEFVSKQPYGWRKLEFSACECAFVGMCCVIHPTGPVHMQPACARHACACRALLVSQIPRQHLLHCAKLWGQLLLLF
jgi:hypothetical protein